MPKDTLKHPTLGCTLRGHLSTSAIQFRNLKYATIPGRWEDSTAIGTLTSNSGDVYDATGFGPSSPHKRGAQALDLSLIGDVKMPIGEGHKGQEEEMDEFQCLTVNVTVPNSVSPEGGSGKGLPVFVWIHGGGLTTGSNTWPQYDHTKFVERSDEIGKPVITVSINYRVGILGFLASKELGIKGNFGFKDQVLAFKWVKKHIAGFGGDPNNVTAAGESAGGISLSVLLCANIGDEGLFERVVIMSGEATLRKPRIIQWHEKMYQDEMKLLGLDEWSVDERVKRLRQIRAEDLVSKLPIAQGWCGCIDGSFLEEDIRLSTVGDGTNKQHKPDWCKEFVVGETAHDGTVLKGRVPNSRDAIPLLESLCAKYLTPSETSELFIAYGIPAMTIEQHYHSLLQLSSELRFYLPSLTVHSGWRTFTPPRNCGRYHFHVPNPIEGAFVGLESHEFDVACLLQNFDEYLDQRTKDVARQMADQWIRFTNGEGWCEENKVIVIGGVSVEEVDENEYDEQFRSGRGRILEKIGAEKLWKVAEEWQGVRSEEQL